MIIFATICWSIIHLEKKILKIENFIKFTKAGIINLKSAKKEDDNEHFFTKLLYTKHEDSTYEKFDIK